MVKICRVLGIPHDVLSFNEIERVDPKIVAEKLNSNTYTHVAIIHCETSSGILNPIEDIGQLVYNHGAGKGKCEHEQSRLLPLFFLFRFNCVYR